MKKVLTAALAVVASLIFAAPAFAVDYDLTVRDAGRDVHVVHNGFSGNQDIDIIKAHYQYYGYRQLPDLVIELQLRRVRPDLATHQLYRTEFIRSGRRYLIFANDSRSGSLYLYSQGAWQLMNNCDIHVTLNPSSTLFRGTNVSIEADSCWTGKRVRILYTKTANYYSASMTDVAASDRVGVRRVIGHP